MESYWLSSSAVRRTHVDELIFQFILFPDRCDDGENYSNLYTRFPTRLSVVSPSYVQTLRGA